MHAVFGNLTGEDARPTLWRGRPRPRQDREAVKAGQQLLTRLPALKLKRWPIIKASLPTSLRLRRAGRDGMFSLPKRATCTAASNAPGSLDIWKTEIVLRRSKIFIATGIQIAVSSVGAA